MTLLCDKMCQGSLKFPVEQRDEKKDSMHVNLVCVCVRFAGNIVHLLSLVQQV